MLKGIFAVEPNTREKVAWLLQGVDCHDNINDICLMNNANFPTTKQNAMIPMPVLIYARKILSLTM